MKGLPWISYAIVMAGASAAEHDYQVKTLNRIIEDTGGYIVPLGEMDIWGGSGGGGTRLRVSLSVTGCMTGTRYTQEITSLPSLI